MKYTQKLILCKAALNEDKTSCSLQLPFQVYHQEVVHKGRNYGCYPLPPALDKEEVLAVVSVSTEDLSFVHDGKTYVQKSNDLAKAEKEAGLITDFQKDARVKTHWAVTKEDYYATHTALGETVKYDGADKADLAQFCVSESFVKHEEVRM